MLIELILIGLGLALLMKGADFLVDGSSKIAKRFNIPEIVIGLTIVAIGTSLPELVISVASALEGVSDISIGNVVGSNIANLFLIISLCAVVKPLVIKKEVKYIENQMVILCTGILYLIVQNDGVITKLEGIALLAICLLYILYNVVMAKVGNKLDEEETSKEENEKIENDNKVKENKINSKQVKSKEVSKIKKIKQKVSEKITFKNRLWYCALQIILGIIALKYGGDFVVDNAVLIAAALGISEKLIALTIVAFGTSLPELITCLSATRRGETDLAIGNIAGSQIFNILLILGSAAILTPIQGVRGFLDEITILLIGNIIFAILPFIGQKDKVGRASGIAFVAFYFIYMANLIYENIA